MDDQGVARPSTDDLESSHLQLSIQDRQQTKPSNKHRNQNSRVIPRGMVTGRVCCRSQIYMTEQTNQAPSLDELIETIAELSAYRERLYDDVVGLGK